MTFRVGLLYAVQEFLQFISKAPITSEMVREAQTKFGPVHLNEIFEICRSCDWVRANVNGTLQITFRGEELLATEGAKPQLRLQILHLLEVEQPVWGKKLRYGREEVLAAMPDEVKQCFEESGLLETWTDELVRAWAILTKGAWVRRSTELDDIGLQAEWWSMLYEYNRVGRRPNWVSRNSTHHGFDVLSQKEKRDNKLLRIEVKGSVQSVSNASFFVTKHEWKTATTSPDYVFYLWKVAAEPMLFVVQSSHIAAHVAKNRGKGEWSSIEIPYKVFGSSSVPLGAIKKKMFDQRYADPSYFE